tara:strand:- start:270 stop:1190 length:921 start_codon:yes stop_codon:yes gene_type:complete
MNNHWRPAYSAPWSALLDMKQRTALVFQYIVSGNHTNQTRICRARIAEVAGLFESSPRAISADLATLESEGLIALTIDGKIFEAYPVGSWRDCRATPQSRVTVLRLLSSSLVGRASVACRSDLGDNPVTVAKPAETKQAKTVALDKPKASAGLQASASASAKGSRSLAPATPGHAPKEGLKKRPKIGRNPAPAAKVVAVTRAYLDICVPARMPKVNTDADGMPSPAIAKTVAKAIKANGAEYDWRGLFRQASRGAHLRGENDRQWRASLAWLCNPTNAAKVESGNYGDTSPPPPPGTRRSYPNFPE